MHILSICKVPQKMYLKLFLKESMIEKSKILEVKYLHLKYVMIKNFVELPNLFNVLKKWIFDLSSIG